MKKIKRKLSKLDNKILCTLDDELSFCYILEDLEDMKILSSGRLEERLIFNFNPRLEKEKVV